MFGGLGGAFKNLTGKAEEILEKTKDLAVEKKAAAQSMLEGQVKKTGESVLQTKGDVEKTAVGVAVDSKQAAIEGFDKELTGAENTVDATLTETKAQQSEAAAGPGFDPAMLANLAIGGGDPSKQVDAVIEQVGSAVDTKIKETDKYLDEKREEVVKTVQAEAVKTTETATQGVGGILGKAKGLLNF